MAQAQCIARLGGWEGYEIEAEQDEQRGALRWCVIRLRPVTGRGRCCSGCGQSVPAIHDLEERRIRDLPVFESPVVDFHPILTRVFQVKLTRLFLVG